MKKILCALALVVASFGVATPVAFADTPRCVSYREYRHVHRGMPIRRVHRVFDTRGHRIGGGRVLEIRSYRPCSRNSAVSVSYRHRRLVVKIWL